MLVRPEIGSRVREVIAEYTAEEVYSTKRQEIQDIGRERTKKMMGEMAERETGEQQRIKLSETINIYDVLILDIELPAIVVNAINRKIEQYYISEEYKFRVERERRESERKQIEAVGIRNFQQTVSQGISDSYLRWRGIEATLQLAQSNNAKIVIVGGGKDGLPIILGNVDGPAAPPAARPAPPEGEPRREGKTDGGKSGKAAGEDAGDRSGDACRKDADRRCNAAVGCRDASGVDTGSATLVVAADFGRLRGHVVPTCASERSEFGVEAAAIDRRTDGSASLRAAVRLRFRGLLGGPLRRGWRQERHRDQVRRQAKSQVDDPAVADGGGTLRETDFDVVMFEEGLIERKNRLVRRFLGDEEQPATVGVLVDLPPLGGRRDQFQQFGRQRFRRLDVDAQRADVMLQPDRRDRDPRIVRHGANDACRPDWRARGRFRQFAIRDPQSREKLPRDETRRAARPTHTDDA